MNSFVYKYSRFRRIGEAAGFLMSFGFTLIAVLTGKRIFAEPNWDLYFLPLLISILGALGFFALAGYTMFPNIRISDDSLSIYFLWHWHDLPWSHIQVAHELHGLIFTSEYLPIGYLLPSSRWGRGRAFFINKSINRHELLVSHLKRYIKMP